MAINKNSNNKEMDYYHMYHNMDEMFSSVGFDKKYYLSQDTRFDKATKQFFHVDSFNELKKLLENENNLYEIIPENRQRYSHFDLDGVYDFFIKCVPPDMDCETFILREFQLKLEEFKLSINIDDDMNLVILKGTKPSKISYHIIDRSIILKDCYQCNLYHKKFIEYCKDSILIELLDDSIYTKNRNFRCVNQSKKAQPNQYPLICDNPIVSTLVCCQVGIPIDIPNEWKYIQHTEYVVPKEIDFDNSEIVPLLDKLNDDRFCNRSKWRNLIWCLISLGVDTDIIHHYSYERCIDKYTKKSTDEVINCYKSNNNWTINTLKKWINEDSIELQVKIEKSSTIIKNDRYVGDDIYDQKITLIRAGLGRGKTTSVTKHINNTNYKNYICLTPRRTFATSLCNRLNNETTRKFKLYTDKCFDISGLVIQAESLHKIQDIKFGDDTLIIVDECESFLQQMTSTTTHKSNHQTNFDVFLRMLNCNIIFMDAFLSSKTLTFLNDCDKQYTLYEYVLPPDSRNSVEIQPESEVQENGKIKVEYYDPFCKKMMSLIAQGKKGYIFIASKDALKGFLQIIDGTFPNIKKAIYYADKKDCLKDVNDSWSKVDLVICNSALTIGVNFDKIHFDFIGCYTQASVSNLVRDIFQSFYRIRHVSTLYYAVDPTLYNFNVNTTTNIVEIKKRFSNTNFWFTQHYNEHFSKNIPICKIYEEAIFNLFINSTLEQALSVREIKSEFDKYLKICGYINVQDTQPTIKVDYYSRITGDTPYENIPEITQEEYYRLLNNQFRKESDTLILEKYVFQQTIWYNKIDNYSLNALWSMFKKCDDKKKIRNIAYEKSLQDKTITINSIVSHALPILASKMSLKLEMVNKITQWLGLKNTYDTKTPIKNNDKLIDIFKDNVKQIYDIFKLRDRRKNKDGSFMNCNFTNMDFKTVIMITNQVFSKWGYSTVKKAKQQLKTINGKRINIINDYIIEIENDIYDNIIPHNYKENNSTIDRPKDINL